MSALLIGDSILHYESIGKGKPVLFLHNFIGSWRYWVPAMKFLSGHFRCYALDFWGFGDSSKKESLYNLDAQSELLSQFLQRMGIPKIAIVGHGFGSVVGNTFGLKHPTQVDRFLSVTMKHPPKSIQEGESFLAGNDVGESIRMDCKKADKAAILSSIEILASHAEWSEIAPYPHLSLVSDPNLDERYDSTNTIALGAGNLFPMLSHQDEFNRLLLEYLTGDPSIIDTSLSVKQFWKRRVR